MVPHTIIVDFAIALLVVSVAFDALASVIEETELRVVSWWTLLIGTVAAALSVVSGLAAASPATPEPEILDTINLHRNSGYVTLTCFAVCAAWRIRHPGSFPDRFRDVYWALAGIGLGALIVTGYFGGILVFRLGVGVLPLP